MTTTHELTNQTTKLAVAGGLGGLGAVEHDPVAALALGLEQVQVGAGVVLDLRSAA
jgi:hypothetical protein